MSKFSRFIVWLCCCVPTIALAANNTIEISSLDTGIEGNGVSQSPSLSQDSTLIAFASTASNLVSGDNNNVADIFVVQQDVALPGKTVFSGSKSFSRISVSSEGIEANGSSTSPFISSATGRFVVFVSSASNLVNGDTNDRDDIFVRDRQLGTTTRVSVAMDINGSLIGESNGHSLHPHISIDGCYIVFSSDATNLQAIGINGLPIDDTNGKRDIFLYYNPQGDNGCSGGNPYLEFISLDSNEGLGNGDSDFGHVGDSRYIAFASSASNFNLGDTNGVNDIYVRDRAVDLSNQSVPRVTILVSQSSTGIVGNAASYTAQVESNLVAFDSDASNLVANDTNQHRDIFFYRLDSNRGSGTTTLESLTVDGQQGDGDSSQPSLAAGANYLAFQSAATNFSSRRDCNQATDVFVRDYLRNSLDRVSLSLAGYQSNFGKKNINPQISKGAFLVAFESEDALVPNFSDNGAFDVFASQASEDPDRIANPFTGAKILTEAPDVCVDGRSLKVYLESFPNVSEQKTVTAKKSSKCNPTPTQVCYDLQVGTKGNKSDGKRKQSKLNTVTVGGLKPGKYKVSFRVSGKSGTKSVTTNRSPIRTVTVKRRRQ